jgi:hypothetical protein
MGDRFMRSSDGAIVVALSQHEKVFLSDVTALLRDVDSAGSDDLAATRLRLPVYLDDAAATDEWWRLMGAELSSARAGDRSLYDRVMGDDGEEVVLGIEEAEALLRVLNEGRLALAARLGVQVESDFDDLDEGERMGLDFLHWLVDDLTGVLSKTL